MLNEILGALDVPEIVYEKKTVLMYFYMDRSSNTKSCREDEGTDYLNWYTETSRLYGKIMSFRNIRSGGAYRSTH